MRRFQPKHPEYLTNCTACGGRTSKKYARAHEGQCKRCVEPPASDTPTREQRILEHGYQAYAREEGYFDDGS